MSIYKLPFGNLPDGTAVSLYVLRNENGFQVSISDFGGTLVSILAPDRNGIFHNVALGYESANEYAIADGYLGATVGRFANRLAKGAFTVDGKTYGGLYINDGVNTLHGGNVGYSHRMWEASTVDGCEPALRLHLVSPDGEENYPGTLDVTVTYTVTADNALSLHYEATTDKPTVVSLTNHVYFNLGGCASGDVFGHILQLDAESYLRGDDGLIPTGEIVPVDGTPFDFRTPKAIGKDFFADDNDLKLAGGYDHCFNFTGWQQDDGEIRRRGTAYDPKSGRKLTMLTNSPCVQLYTANFLKGEECPLAGGQPRLTQHGFCLETQKMPDSPNHEGFTNAVLRPGEVWDYTTIYRFSVE
ncbi:MAG: galactose mutarotase [Clostridia bacterium]|nr:galactose mutarotase [Clostridia bacterium]